ncbi:MAG: polyamine ABC transporter substrate-binding protein [Mesorhizobium amorphae]|nr:MAG: polyamine ABC transporter substrate-binding protein [Mesorhizobium amorphae]
MTNETKRHAMARLSERARTGEISRRQFTQLAAILMGAAPFALKSGGAFAQDKALVLVNWGGDALDAYDAAYGQAFTKDTGIAVRMDGSGPTEGAIEAQFKSGAPTWDLVDLDPFSAITLGAKGMLEPIDYSVVDRAKTREGFGWEYAASTYFFSYVLAYDSEKYETAPTGMADLFDIEKFPGQRTLYKWGVGNWEAALLADGVAPDALYPLDLARAHKKLEALKPNVVGYWGGGAESQAFLLDGEASMGLVWSTRASLIEQDSGGRIKFLWDQGLISPGALGVIKNNPAGKDAAMRFIASAQDPEKQLVMFEKLGQGPANPAADALVPEDRKRFNPVDPANIAKQIPLDMDWYAQNYTGALDEFTKLISA